MQTLLKKFRDLERTYAAQHLDIISDMRCVNSFFCSTSHPILEQAG